MGTLTNRDTLAFGDSYATADSKTRRVPPIVGTLLFVLLVFATTTVFVRAAWPLECFQIGVLTLLGVYLLLGIGRAREIVASGVAHWFVYLIPLWGIGQILAHTTISTLETREAVLRWGALAGVFFLGQAVGASRLARRTGLTAFVVFATCMAVLCVAQLFTSNGLVLWIFPTGYPDVYATFQNQNNYAQFVELALPVALWRALREGWRSWWYGLSSGILYASVIASASRAGTVICTVELFTLLVVGFVRLRNSKTSRLSRSTLSIFLLVPIIALVFTLAVGWQRVWIRLEGNDPFSGRREFLIAAVEMVKHRPLAGFGLGTFPEVYQQYAVKDFPFYANHAHNDWAEFAADGGIPFLLLVLIPFAGAISTSLRHPWGLGLIAVMIHACVDYPFPRPAVSGWIFALLAMLYMARTSDKHLLLSLTNHADIDSSE